MTYNLYIDVVFLVNFLMDYLLLAVLRILLKFRKTRLQMALASFAGALWACVAIAFPLLPGWLEGAITYLGVGSLMVWIAFRPRGVMELSKGVIGLYMVTVMVAGAGYLLYEHTRAGYYIELILSGNMRKAMPVYIFLLLVAGVYFGARYGFSLILEERRQNGNLYSVTLHYKGKIKVLTALLDTGNHLREPVTGAPVSVVSYEAFRTLSETVHGLIFIPYQAVGTKSGMLAAIKIDEMEIEMDHRHLLIREPLIAISKEPLSADGRYQMLLHEELLDCQMERMKEELL